MWMNPESATPACSNPSGLRARPPERVPMSLPTGNYSHQPTPSLLTLSHPVLPLRSHSATSIPDLAHCLCILIHSAFRGDIVCPSSWELEIRNCGSHFQICWPHHTLNKKRNFHP